MQELNVALLAIGTLVLLLGLVSDYLKRVWWGSAPLTALLCGVLLSPVALDVLHPSAWGLKEADLLEQAARFTLAIGLMGVALRLPKGYVFRHWQPLTVLLALVMPLMWISSGLLVYWLLTLPFWEAMLVGAVITPTDPIVASSIVTGVVAEENLPGRIRHPLSAESGANDGLAYPFVFLSILMIQKPPVEALSHWFGRTLLWEVLGAVLAGALIGYAAGRLLEWAESLHTIESRSFIGYTIALSVVVLGAAKLIGTDGILAVFVAGLIFSEVVQGKERAEEENVQEAINRFFVLPVFVLVGLTLPWQEWWQLGWKVPVLILLVLLLRRLPAILLLNRWLTPIKNIPEALFLGWFGPIGVAALFYAGLSLRETGVREAWVVASFMICASLLVHGLSATPLTKRYGQWAQRHRTQAHLSTEGES